MLLSRPPAQAAIGVAPTDDSGTHLRSNNPRKTRPHAKGQPADREFGCWPDPSFRYDSALRRCPTGAGFAHLAPTQQSAQRGRGLEAKHRTNCRMRTGTSECREADASQCRFVALHSGLSRTRGERFGWPWILASQCDSRTKSLLLARIRDNIKTKRHYVDWVMHFGLIPQGLQQKKRSGPREICAVLKSHWNLHRRKP